MSGPTYAAPQPQRPRTGSRPVSQPSDRHEHEAERAADVVARGGSVRGWSFSAVPGSSGAPAQRQEAGKPKSDEDKLKEGLKTAGEAAVATPEGKKLKEKVLSDPDVKKLTDAVTSTPGLIVTGVAAAGGVGALAATGKPLPFQPPEIPLDKISPKLAGVSAKVTYEGPVNRPTFVGLTITVKEHGPTRTKKPDPIAAETARLKAEEQMFRKGMRYAPGSKKAEEERLLDQAVQSYVLRGSGLPGLTFPVTPGGAEKKQEDTPAQRSPASGAAAPAHADVDAALTTPGRPLDPVARREMERRFGQDFASVRIHDDARVAAVAAGIDAAAFTVGEDIAVAGGRLAGGAGERLLAHELAHVVQQRRAGRRVDRQQGRPQQQGPQAAPPAFSVSQPAYEDLVRRALQAMAGRLPMVTTFASATLPILRAMFDRVTWRDSKGADHGGGVYDYHVPGTRTVLHLRLVLDDMLDPPEAGQFVSRATDGTIFVRVRKSSTAEGLAEVVYHESLHMMTWIINTHHGAAAAAGVERRAVRGLELSHYRPQIAGIRRELEDLAGRANQRRRTAGRPEIAPADLERTAGWLMEEIQVRAETEVFQQTLQVESQRGQRAAVYIPTQQYGAINHAMVEQYVFEFSRTFTPDDRRGLTPVDQETLRILTEMLEGSFQLHVRRRFSLAAYTIGVPRERPMFELPPLTPPSLVPRIGAAARGEPF